jgi:hypothetical protein
MEKCNDNYSSQKKKKLNCNYKLLHLVHHVKDYVVRPKDVSDIYIYAIPTSRWFSVDKG